ncbi:FAD-binding domain-containing protein [Deinococcus soli (ex Cha et al. 2016)]|uniref:Deoxyribodipyrimidine photo-lyase n=2 Tax=Deinococcus soli (ex Cha et al. 2016) TaxID=1309411 RepID=A0AAE3XFM0_9DEIO|nr:FAD-binding domain-containing protein [Deinococcus soli (ex Cha et al. 2016)]MDR6220542.1 deoxyribodipyrimidine photo-lyase [Deinococcus soli (ex Cha et al. 2016)]MDR6330372.1 deoxyribodipyrimidine photo-lyase [Deinococcus soli (ex Cha et al. 2016)]MDR6753214.1 deoxyribodipyrimidine photo-lyase [Deinococcus soli (ex Cha et al. 2016)]
MTAPPADVPLDLPDAQLPGVLGAALAGLYTGEPRLPARPGGRAAGLAALHAWTGAGYRERNHLSGNVSRLSMYLRHGMLGIREVAAHARHVLRGRERDEFLRQLTWGEFFRLVLRQEGARVLDNLEEPKYPARWTAALPDDIRTARTDLPCVDAWVTHLTRDGWLHNHERLWFAAYLIHWRGVHWRAGYAFFREHLLDGDIASNALSWQWVASTFSGKPYFMNQENVERFSGGRWCRTCTANCPFRGSYEELEARLFSGRPPGESLSGEAGTFRRAAPAEEPAAEVVPAPVQPTGPTSPRVVWVHGDGLSVTDPALSACPDAPALFVFDRPFLSGVPIAFPRLAFMYQGVRDIAAARRAPTHARVGAVAGELAAFARAYGAGELHVTRNFTPEFTRILAGVRAAHPDLRVVVHEPERLTSYDGPVRRFFGFWKKVEREVLQGAPSPDAPRRGHR